MSEKPVAPEHLRFAVLAVDVALFTVRDNELLVRIVRVQRPPQYPDTPALPGGLIKPDEETLDAINRIISVKTHIDPEKIYVEQLFTFSAPTRDPRGRVVSVAYIGLVPWQTLTDAERVDTADSWWTPVRRARSLAYDHDEMLALAVRRMRSRCTYTTLIKALMPREFTLTELETMYATILGTTLDKRNFRKKILKLRIVRKVPRKRSGGKFRPAQLYAYASRTVTEIKTL